MTSFVSEMLSVIAERGRNLVTWPGSENSDHSVVELSQALLSEKGEASSIAIASELFTAYEKLSDEQRLAYFVTLADEFCADADRVQKAADAFLKNPDDKTSFELHVSSESRRQELFRRLNHAPDGTRQLVHMRQDLLKHSRKNPDLARVDADFLHLFSSWFNRGFLVMQRITWATPATILDKLIEYEAVHEIDNWDELRRRIQPSDRRCYAFFHPALTDDPLIFVEVALTQEVSRSMDPVLAQERQLVEKSNINTAVFYSISNCQKGLAGVSFGSFLIKQVVEELVRDLPQIKTFVTLSPVPGFMTWLKQSTTDEASKIVAELPEQGEQLIASLEQGKWPDDAKDNDQIKDKLIHLAADYFFNAKHKSGKPLDPVARFHLGNGARLENLNWAGDQSAKGLAQSAGLMVNYLYEPGEIEKNHQIYENEERVVASSKVTRHLKNTSLLRGK